MAGLLILGPERLPGAIRWSANVLRQARDYVSGATGDLRDEFGPEFDELRVPFGELQKLRGMTPRAALTKHLLDGDDSLFAGRFDLPGENPEPTPPLASPDRSPSSPPNASTRPGSIAPFDSDVT